MSAWGKSWGSAWGSAWGAYRIRYVLLPIIGGGFSQPVVSKMPKQTRNMRKR